MVILLGPYGQRSNNLFQHVHIDSYCRNNGIYFYNSFIYKFRRDYPNIGKPNILLDLLLKVKLLRILRRFKIVKYINFGDEFHNDQYKAAVLKYPILSCEGWFLWSNTTVAKYRKLYQHIFDPAVDKVHLQAKFLSREIGTNKIVGVHIRRGDYILHEDGKYFFDDAVYLDKMQQLVAQLSKNIKFLLFSNDDALDKDLYRRAFDNVLILKYCMLILLH
ncbi:MAG: hypothetical protein EOP45_17385 [Sphingobacteriaceae bacterium]|nr:MAG: hypothetical protein EOP45_17385 [Sphingobacteriaceae bacterium]